MSRRGASLTLRLTALFAAGSALVLLALGALFARAVERHFLELDRHAVLGKLDLVRHGLRPVRDAEDLRDLPARLGPALIGHHDLAVRIEADGRLLLAQPDEEFAAGAPAAAGDGGEAPLGVWTAGGRRYRGLTVTLDPMLTPDARLKVTVAVDLAHHDQFMAELRRSLWWFVGGGACALGLVGWLAVRRGLAPLARMRKQAASVNARRLDQRLDADAVPAELADLARDLNAMLARLEDAFTRLRDFSSDLAHELRTPISNLIMQTQVALAKPRDATAYREVLESNAEEYERLARMIGDMLFLAQTENGLALARREPVDLAAEVASLFEFYELAAGERQVALRLSGAARIEGDRLMLRRALGNLLSNAIRHAASATVVTVSLLRQEECRVAVANQGDRIPPADLPHVFDRFWRADRARQAHEGGGAGLGLAITQAIAQAHGGRCEAESAVTDGVARTVFTLVLPAS